MSGRKSEKHDSPTSKTPHVMKLVDRHDEENQVILAGKSVVPKQLRGIEPLSKLMKREAAQVRALSDENEEKITVNLTGVVTEEIAAPLLRRFNACDCVICVERLSVLTSEKIPSRFVKVRKSVIDYNTDEILRLKEPLKKTVTSEMIRIILANKKRSFHD